MAKNLRQKIPKEDTLYVHDVNTDAVQKFIKELSEHEVVAAPSARSVAELSVSSTTCYTSAFYDEKPTFPIFV
jgi:hypothetical protein